MNNFEKIKNVVLTNSERKITISEISQITSINRSKVRALLHEFDTEKQLVKFIVDGRKFKFESKPLVPTENDFCERCKGDSTNISGSISYFDSIEESDLEKNCNHVVERVCSSEDTDLQCPEKIEAEEINQFATICESTDIGEISSNPEKSKTILYSDLFYGKTLEILFDSTILDLTMNQFNSVLGKIAKRGFKPKFVVFKEDVLLLDMNKEKSYLAKELLKFFAQDSTECFHELRDDEKPSQKFLAKLCSEHNFTLISGNAKNIVWAKLYNADVIIPEPFLKNVPNPCCGKGVIGLDSCMMAINQEELNQLLKQYEKILVSDIQIEEIPGGHLLDLIAFYGEVKFADRESKDEDMNICNFYSKNEIAAMYTIDYGCYLFGQLSHVNCHLYNYFKASESQLLRLANSLFMQPHDVKSGDEIVLDQMNNIVDNAVLILNEFPNISIFSPAGQKRENEVRKAYSQDYLTIHVDDTVVIAQVKKRQRALVRYAGQETDTPREYKKFLL